MRAEFDSFANQLLAGEVASADGRHGLLDTGAIVAVHETADRSETGRP